MSTKTGGAAARAPRATRKGAASADTGKVTLEMVAAAAGVSPSTVSRILNGTAVVAEEKRAAEEGRAFLNPVEQGRKLVRGQAFSVDGREGYPGAVEALPHLARKRGALRARITPRGGQTGIDA